MYEIKQAKAIILDINHAHQRPNSFQSLQKIESLPMIVTSLCTTLIMRYSVISYNFVVKDSWIFQSHCKIFNKQFKVARLVVHFLSSDNVVLLVNTIKVAFYLHEFLRQSQMSIKMLLKICPCCRTYFPSSKIHVDEVDDVPNNVSYIFL